jgi:hypothetical protein
MHADGTSSDPAASTFERLADRGLLQQLDDTQLAAAHVN